MTGVVEWTGVEPLPTGETILLEASAGTGKTWQIEGLVVRLVAEYELTVDRILVITFTNAATAELRDRVRRRLVQARDALGSAQCPASDPILAHLWSDEGARLERRSRLAAALSSFDLAPISTIHGFSQRMLDQLAFESGQEPGLELLTDPGPILQQLVDDEVARVYADASEEELTVLLDMGWDRRSLMTLATAMTGAVECVLEPAVAGGDPSTVSPLEVVRSWLETKKRMRAWLDSDEGVACVQAVRDEVGKKKGKRLKGFRERTVTSDLETLKRWLDGPAARRCRLEGKRGLRTGIRNLRLSSLDEKWSGEADEKTSFGGYGLFQRTEGLIVDQDHLWSLALLGFAARARAHVNRELTRGGQLTYSTMLSRLAERVAEQGPEGDLASAIRRRYDVALVDEFQDTDGAQWPVIEAVFAHPERRLLVIGDPKQAIYSFRGADVHVYLDAANVADVRATMPRNWRSDGDYIGAMNHLWSEGSDVFDLTDVDYVEVDWPAAQDPPRIRGLPSQGERPRRPFELRWVDGQTVGTAGPVIASKAVGENATAQLAALEIARLLEAGTQLLVARDGRDDPEWSELLPGDIAVLVRTGRQAERVRVHLERLRIPSVSAGRGSVMQSPVVEWLCAWLDAVAEPGRDHPARRLATTPLFGWTVPDLALALAAADDDFEGEPDPASVRWESWLQRIHGWATSWSTRGFVRVLEAALDEFDVLSNLLEARQGERHATDLRHLVELVHAEERRTRVGPSGLATWLRAARAAAGDGEDDAEALRLESDARAVQLVTIHKSKGLEYPVTLVPFGWADREPSDRGEPLRWHAVVGEAPDSRMELRLNLESGGTVGRQRAFDHLSRETRQEQLRLLYVALTRARHHCIAWLGPIGRAGGDTASHALGRVALRPRDDEGTIREGAAVVFPKSSRSKDPRKIDEARRGQSRAWDSVRERLDALAASSKGTLGWSLEPPIEARAPLTLGAASAGPLATRPWPPDRGLDSAWQVSSYSSMVSGRTFDDGEPRRLDETRSTTADSAAEGDVGAQVDLGEPSATAAEDREAVDREADLREAIATEELHGGTDVGTWAHAVMEHLDFQDCVAWDGRDLLPLVAELGARLGVRSGVQHELLAAALPAVLDTPLDGPDLALPPGYSLRSLGPDDRLDELGFDLGVGAGNRWRRTMEGDTERRSPQGRLNHEGAAVALESRLADTGWSGLGWLRALLDRARQEDRGVLPRIAGILTGFIDLVFRVEVEGDGSGAAHRYFVCDYKTNRIRSPSRRQDSLRLHYTQPWLAWEMAHHGYHLQALLYTVALHRTLRQRLPDYAYDTHVGGHLYLFLRGMVGSATPRDGGLALGVYHDRWPAPVVLGLDAALRGAGDDEVRAVVEAAAKGGVR